MIQKEQSCSYDSRSNSDEIHLDLHTMIEKFYFAGNKWPLEALFGDEKL